MTVGYVIEFDLSLIHRIEVNILSDISSSNLSVATILEPSVTVRSPVQRFLHCLQGCFQCI